MRLIDNLSKNAQRRLRYTYVVKYKGVPVGIRFDIGRFLDRSKYNGDGTRK